MEICYGVQGINKTWQGAWKHSSTSTRLTIFASRSGSIRVHKRSTDSTMPRSWPTCRWRLWRYLNWAELCWAGLNFWHIKIRITLPHATVFFTNLGKQGYDAQETKDSKDKVSYARLVTTPTELWNARQPTKMVHPSKNTHSSARHLRCTQPWHPVTVLTQLLHSFAVCRCVNGDL